MKRFLLGIVCAICISISVQDVHAAEFKLWKIGSLDTGGIPYNIWYYTGKNVALYGTTSSGSNVDIYIDGTVATVRAEGTGNWSYDPGSLSDGSHRITISSESNSYTFTLVLGSSVPDSVKAQLPVAGSAEIALGTAAAAMVLFGVGYYAKRMGRPA